LIRVDRDDGVHAIYEYQHDGLCFYRRVEDPSLPGGVEETVFVYHGPLLIAEFDRTGGANRPRARYYYAEGDVPVAADIADGTGQLVRYYLLQENNGSIMGLVDSTGAVVERYFYDAWGQPEIQAPDTQPPVIDSIVAEPGGFLIHFTETVLPPLIASAPPGIATSMGSLAGSVTVTVDGRTVQGAVTYEESSPAGFGRTFHFLAGSSLVGTNAVLHFDAGRLVDQWNNANPAQAIGFTLDLTPGKTNFVRESRTPTDQAPVARSTVGSPFLFHGQYFEYDTGLVYMRARHYDPGTGQFLQRDPEQYDDSVNLYAGFGHNPLSRRDPEGVFWKELIQGLQGTRRQVTKQVRRAWRTLVTRETPRGRLNRLRWNHYEKVQESMRRRDIFDAGVRGNRNLNGATLEARERTLIINTRTSPVDEIMSAEKRAEYRLRKEAQLDANRAVAGGDASWDDARARIHGQHMGKGVAFMHPDETTLKKGFANRQRDPDWFDVLIHGDADGNVSVRVKFNGKPGTDWEDKTFDEVIDAMFAAGYEGQKIRVFTCYGGRSDRGLAAYLSRAFGVEVLAGSGRTMMSSSGHAVNTGIWRLFNDGVGDPLFK
jgi:RHS repeat-associated protein